MKRVAAGAPLLTPWHYRPVKRPENRADYCLDCSFLPKCEHWVPVYNLLGRAFQLRLGAESREVPTQAFPANWNT